MSIRIRYNLNNLYKVIQMCQFSDIMYASYIHVLQLLFEYFAPFELIQCLHNTHKHIYLHTNMCKM